MSPLFSRYGFMLAWLFVFSLFSKPALAQSSPFGTLDYESNSELYSGSVAREDRSWPTLKQSIDVQIKPDSHVFRFPEYLFNRKHSPLDELGYTKCPLESGGSAKLLSVIGDMAVVRLHGEGCSSNFNMGDDDPNVAFIKLSRLTDVQKHESILSKVTKPICNLAIHPAQRLEEFIFTPTTTGVKDDSDQEAWFDCYATKYTPDYKAHLKDLIELAGRTFDISVTYENGKRNIKPAIDGKGFSDELWFGAYPFIASAKPKIMKCLIYRESGWQAGVQNKVSKATGLGQQTDVDVASINCLLHGCEKEFKVMKDKKEVIVLKQVPPQPWAQTLWRAYFSRAKASMSASEWRKLNTNPRTGEPCTQEMSVKTRDAACPINSIAAVAIDQVAIELMVRESTPKYKNSYAGDFTQEEQHELSLIYGASHDAGISKAAAAAKSSGDIFEWAKFLVKNKNAARHKEVGGYYNDLSKCMNEGNFEPMNGYKKRKCEGH